MSTRYKLAISFLITLLGSISLSFTVDLTKLFSSGQSSSSLEWEFMTKYRGTKVGKVSLACKKLPSKAKEESYWYGTTFQSTLTVTSVEGCNTDLIIYTGLWVTDLPFNCTGRFRLIHDKKNVSLIHLWVDESKECSIKNHTLNLYPSR